METNISYPGATIESTKHGYKGYLRLMVAGVRKKSPTFHASSFAKLKKLFEDWKYSQGFEKVFQKNDTLTAGDYLKQWLESSFRTIKPNTKSVYEATWNKYLSSTPWYDTPLASVTKLQMSKYFNTLEASPHTRNRVYKIVRAAFYTAMENDIIQSNPALFAKKERPKKPESTVVSFRPEQEKAIIATVKDNPMWLAILVCAFDSGARFAELVGIQKGDLLFSERRCLTTTTFIANDN